MSRPAENVIPDETVEATWQRVAEMEPGDASSRMQATCTEQPALIAYVLASLEDSPEEVQELGVYLCYAVHEMFEAHAGEKLAEVPIERVEHHRDRNEELFSRYEGSDERFLEKLALNEMSHQPHVMRSVAEALVEENEADDAVDLDGEEQGLLFLVLKTVVDALDESVRSAA